MKKDSIEKKKILVIPDVHGRTFWKKPCSEWTGDIVFLGDYLDPYGYEGVTPEMAIENFKEILDFAKSNKDRVHLLLGNHDIHYIGQGYDVCRIDYPNLKEIFNLYIENKNLFDIAWFSSGAFFVHAGVTNEWMSRNGLSGKDAAWMEMKLNNTLHAYEWVIPACGFSEVRNYSGSPLGEIGSCRGGDYDWGSPVWADFRYEVSGCSAFKAEGVVQIVGHTQMEATGTSHRSGNAVCVDSRAAFVWDGEDIERYAA